MKFVKCIKQHEIPGYFEEYDQWEAGNVLRKFVFNKSYSGG